jgi:hypothetical protein
MRTLGHRLIIAACFLTALTPQSARADVAAFDPDLRCAAIGFAMTGRPDATEEQRNVGMMIAAHYVGRLQGHSPTLDIEDQLFQLSQHLTPADLAAETTRCGDEIQALGRSLMEIGDNLRQRRLEAPGAN